MTKPLIDIRHISKRFKIGKSTLHAIRDVSLQIFPGETIGLAGESGCGKSTLGKLLVKIFDLDEGEIYYEEKNISTLTGEALRSFRRNVQIVFQNISSSLNPKMVVEDIIREPLDIHDIGTEKEKLDLVLQTTQAVGLSNDLMKRHPHQLSGGQKQRVAIARALILKPRFIIFDEPLSSLDMTIQVQIVRLLKKLQKEYDLTYLFISHDLGMMRVLSDRIAIMYLGQIVEIGSAQDIWNSPKHPYTQALLSSIPIADPELERKRSRLILHGEIPSPINPPRGCVFHPRCPYAKPTCKELDPILEDKSEQGRGPHFVACHFSNPESRAPKVNNIL